MGSKVEADEWVRAEGPVWRNAEGESLLWELRYHAHTKKSINIGGHLNKTCLLRLGSFIIVDEQIYSTSIQFVHVYNLAVFRAFHYKVDLDDN